MIVSEPPHPLLSSRRPASGPGSTTPSARPAVFRKRELERFLSLSIAAVKLRGKVSVLLTDDETMRRLNQRFRNKNATTDVLSFPAGVVGEARGKQTRLAGDLAISVPTAAGQASAFGHSLEAEIKILLLHGLLHLSGLDHENDGGEMARKEGALRKELGLPRGLIARSGRSVRSAPAKIQISAAAAPVSTATSAAPPITSSKAAGSRAAGSRAAGSRAAGSRKKITPAAAPGSGRR